MAVTGLREWWFMSYYPNLNPLILKVEWSSFTDVVVQAQNEFVLAYAKELPRVLSDIGIAIVSPSMGVMTNKEARKRKLGGEVLCEIY